ncbi:polysialyltransferase family glycosyltransferase [Brevibacterium casei]|uniref:Uncharacterized protein n=1 Tax=Brevibacterium casei TaxID=33889 RepID=A0A269ZAX1_9MICO|nr:polysialyltransferase family glycosyltransferase [Brevibacterium casei]MCT1550445.1 alpha-2,8-polysialyltransferase family protein [Brevibacterium casei]MCT1559143.1 alpha-2,8-polysialyltransferase family protein [Brevibacterium casei]MCT2207000.1 alpha-2,8-polysialyltransferase family protein [Brevibacterium casei]PAK94924.1 hypothetical protein B8X04_11800 [Brevibacterium casei]
MKQIFLVSTFFELVCLAAGVDAGVYDSDAAPALRGTGGVDPTGGTGSDRERILLVSNNAAVLELSRPLTQTPGAESLVARFDRVIDLNAAVAPLHPSTWRPSGNDIPMIEAHLRSSWGLGDEPIELVLESPQVNPAIALGRVFSTATIRVHADGLMSYGPTRNQIPLTNGQRMSTLHYLPLVPGLSPRLLAEFGIVAQPLSLEAFGAVVTELGEATKSELDAALPDIGPDQPWAFAVGQYLAALGLLTDDEETALHVEMIERAAERGFDDIVFKPHPAAPPSQLEPLFDAANRLGVTLTVLDVPVLAEVVVDRLRPDLVIGGFSTALATARAVYSVPALAVGTGPLLEAITPYQNGNRIPLTIIAEVCDGSEPKEDEDRTDLAALIETVSYCMGPEVSRDLRGRAIAYLDQIFATPGDKRVRRYFKRRRLTSLDLPGGSTRRVTPKRFARRTGLLAVRLASRQKRRLTERARTRSRADGA